MPKSGRSYVNQSVSFPPQLLAEARQRAQNLGLAFSAYVQKCLERDLSERGDIVFTEAQERPQLAAEAPQSPQDPAPPKRPRK